MTNYQQTEDIYKKVNYPYKKPLEKLDFESRTKKVPDESGVYYQLSSLHSAGLVPDGFIEEQKGVKYLLQHANQIIRKTVDGGEWLESRQTWIAIDRIDNKE